MGEPKEVYGVRVGAYSDTRVVGVFADEAAARAFARAIATDDRNDPDVLPIPFNPHVADATAGLSPYRVWVDKQGDVFDVETFNYLWDYTEVPVWARDPDHARKVAGERVARLKADGRWPFGWYEPDAQP